MELTHALINYDYKGESLMKNTKKAFLVIFPIIILLAIILGCGGNGKNKDEEAVKAELRKTFNEEFVVHGMDYGSYGGDRYAAYVSPESNPDIVFTVDMWGDHYNGDISEKSAIEDYQHAKENEEIEKILYDELDEFFPGAYLYLSDSDFLYIFYDKAIGTSKKYEEEYEFFDVKVDELIDEGKLKAELTIEITKLDSVQLSNLKEFLKKYPYGDIYRGDNDLKVYGCEYDFHDNDLLEGGTKVGNPPNMSACFQKGWPSYEALNLEEYIRRRELVENAP